MYLEKLIKELQHVSTFTKEDKKNVAINIAICQMQIEIRERLQREARKRKSKNKTS